MIFELDLFIYLVGNWYFFMKKDFRDFTNTLWEALRSTFKKKVQQILLKVLEDENDFLNAGEKGVWEMIVISKGI